MLTAPESETRFLTARAHLSRRRFENRRRRPYYDVMTSTTDDDAMLGNVFSEMQNMIGNFDGSLTTLCLKDK